MTRAASKQTHLKRTARRSILGGILSASWLGVGLNARYVFAAGTELEPTPSQTEGPYYPVSKPARPGGDLIHAAGGGLAEGQPLDLSGRVLDVRGAPVRNAVVEIWQADDRGIYRHPRAPSQGKQDPHFAGYGASVVDVSGLYTFLTIVPVPYTGRPPHVHVKVLVAGRERLTTQLYLEGHADNDRDGLFASLLFGNKEALSIKPKAALLDGVGEAWAAAFDFVV